jgi:hypothetical protein
MEVNRRLFLQSVSAAGLLPAFYARAGAPLLLDPFPVHLQETPYTCGPAAVKMVLAFLGHDLKEAEIARRMGTSPVLGTSNGQLLRAYRKYLAELNTGYTAAIVAGKKFRAALVADNLAKRQPLIVSFLTENYFNPGHPVGHYVVIIGIDQDQNTFTLANPFGRTEVMDIGRFFRLAEWSPKPGDLPGVTKRVPRLFLPRSAAALVK